MKAKMRSVTKRSGLMLFVAAYTLVNTISAEQLLATWPINLAQSFYLDSTSEPITEDLDGYVTLSLGDSWSISFSRGSWGSTFFLDFSNFDLNSLVDGENSSISCYAGNEDGTTPWITDTETNRFGSSPHSFNGTDFEGYTITAISFTLDECDSYRQSELGWNPPTYNNYSVVWVSGTYSFYGEPNLNIHTAVELEWPAVSGLVYQVQWNTNLATNVWHNLGGPIIGDGTTNHVFDSTKHTPQKFYRINIQ